MAPKISSAIDRSNLPESVLVAERRKSSLILEANLLQIQGEYEASTDKFAEAAALDEDLASQLVAQGKLDKAFIHHFSALSCWAQAGDLHHALRLGQQLLDSGYLSQAQHEQLVNYMVTLRSRMVKWIREWRPDLVAAD